MVQLRYWRRGLAVFKYLIFGLGRPKRKSGSISATLLSMIYELKQDWFETGFKTAVSVNGK